MQVMKCPADVETSLRAAGWKGRGGYWFHPMYAGARRWWDAYYQLKSMPRHRRCQRTAEMFNDNTRQAGGEKGDR